MKYLFDTNIFVYHLAGDARVARLFSPEFLKKQEVVISSVVKMELLSFPGIAEREELIIREMINQFRSISISEEVEEVSIYLRRKYHIKLPDAIIAASAFLTSSILISSNKKDFQKISEIRFQAII